MAHIHQRKQQGRAMFVFSPPHDSTCVQIINKETVARCPGWGSDKDCKFFLAEADDAKARLEKSPRAPPSAPRTPASQRTIDAMPTPSTGSRSRVNLFGGGARAGRVASVTDSPTARRFFDADVDNGDLADFVIRQLEQDGIDLKSTTESVIRYAIGSRIGKYEATLKNSEDSLAFAFQKLDRLENGGPC